ncbi:hypothetical protein L2735_13835 [Shewanella olleyana]|uniref:hypothetical protein n=1 Tax=Shewanella olleyana TaxID=135626 RepID=UPI00200CFE2C|nr:hypothetical protein [Shewanella olleyana]MCL1067872.1 hypothetical protein [Shewanella olleyana]
MNNFFSEHPFLATPSSILVITLIIIGLGQLFIRKVYNPSALEWKKVNTIVLGVALVGAYGAILDVRASLASNWANSEKIPLVTELKNIGAYLEYESTEGVCSIQDHAYWIDLCEWFKSASAFWATIEIDSVPKILVKDMPNVETEEQSVTLIFERLNSYNDHRDNFIKTNEAADDSLNFLKFFYPFFLMGSIAVTIVKNSSEIIALKEK